MSPLIDASSLLVQLRHHTTVRSEFSPVHGKKTHSAYFEVTRFKFAIGNSKSDQQGLACLQVSQPDPATTKSPLLWTAMMLPCISHIDDPSEYSLTVSNGTYYWTAKRSTRQDQGAIYLLRNFARLADHFNIGKIMIKVLPEEILLEVFAFYMCEVYSNEKWKILVYMCQRWSSIVFAAPRRLNLQLICTVGMPSRKMLHVWPELPIVVRVRGGYNEISDILAALRKRDRICKIHVDNVSDDELKELAGAMKVTFPTLTDLNIHSLLAALPESLLGGSAPNLQTLRLMNVAFPALPKLLSSSPGLVHLSLFEIPCSWHIPSDAMVDCLSLLTRLEYLSTSLKAFSTSSKPSKLTSTPSDMHCFSRSQHTLPARSNGVLGSNFGPHGSPTPQFC